ncbi:MAG TPA: hypothetical protein VFO39_12780 [Candidatus Sulfotelmatobacter sp.]|nr:hypothetical protein [Candidatus Sulfotelmatobacter sp.]
MPKLTEVLNILMLDLEPTIIRQSAVKALKGRAFRRAVKGEKICGFSR